MQEEQEFIQKLLDPKTQHEAFQKLLLDYQKPLYHQIRNIVLNHDDTDDVLQNTFIKVFQNLKNFKGDSKLFSWMYRIATNEALTFINQKAQKQKISTIELQNKTIHNLNADVYFDGDEIEIKLQKAIANLPQKQQLVFKMRYFEELKYEEIAEILNTSIGALKASYHHATKKNRSLYKLKLNFLNPVQSKTIMKAFKINEKSKIKSGFLIPDTYFDDFSKQILSQLPDKEISTIPLLKRNKTLLFAIAAMLVIALFLPIFNQFLFNSEELDTTTIENHLTYQNDITTYELISELEDEDLNKIGTTTELKDETIEDI